MSLADEDSKHDTVPLTLELLGGTIEEGGGPECRKITTNAGLKLQLLLPRCRIDADQATLSADLLLSDMEQISHNVKVDTVLISGVQFTHDGVKSLKMFLAVQAAAVKHLSIHNVVKDPSGQKEEKQALSSLAMAFHDARLETLDLSHNILGAYIWDNFNSQQQLESLILEDVEMDEDSYENLERNLEKKMYTGHLAILRISNKIPVGPKAVEAGNNILYRCTTLRSLRWLNKSKQQMQQHPGTSGLPCRGLYDLSEKMNRHTHTLKHVELEGGDLSDEDFGDEHGLCGAIKRLNRLGHLKLKNVGLTSDRASMLVAAFQAGKTPLRNLDLSDNMVGDQGAIALSKISENRPLLTHLKYLNICNNNITNDGGVALFCAIGGKGVTDLNVQTDGNTLSMSHVALAIAAMRQKAEEATSQSMPKNNDGVGNSSGHQLQQGDDPKKIESLLESQASMIKDLQLLQKEVQKVTDERDTLVKAFSVLGASQHVEERNTILERLKRLEDKVHGQRQSIRYPTTKAADTRQRASDEGMGASVRSSLESSSHHVPSRTSSQRPSSILREQIRERVRQDVTSLQAQKDSIRARIMADVELLQAQRRRQKEQETSEKLQAKIREKLARKDEERAKVLDDVAKLREQKAIPKRRNSYTVNQLAEGGDSLNLEDSVSSFAGSVSSINSKAQREARRSSELKESSKATVSTPSKESSKAAASVPSSFKLVRQDESFGGKTSPLLSKRKERNLVGQSTSGDRFQRLLHRQIQNQLYKNNNRPSKGDESRRPSLVASPKRGGRQPYLRSASFHVGSSSTRPITRGVQRSHSDDKDSLFAQSLHSDTQTKRRAVGSFAGTRGESRLGASMSELPSRNELENNAGDV
jgi:hypothetical protein